MENTSQICESSSSNTRCQNISNLIETVNEEELERRRLSAWRKINQCLEPSVENKIENQDIDILTQWYDDDVNNFKDTINPWMKRTVCNVCGILPDSEPKILNKSHEIVKFVIEQGQIKGIEEVFYTNKRTEEISFCVC